MAWVKCYPEPNSRRRTRGQGAEQHDRPTETPPEGSATMLRCSDQNPGSLRTSCFSTQAKKTCVIARCV